MTDERANLPSASTMERTVNCPGWLQLAATCPAPKQNPLAAQGTKIHSAYETDNVEGLDETEEQITKRLVRLTDEALRSWTERHGLGQSVITELREKRMWIRNRDTLDKIASAQLDRGFLEQMFAKFALVLDAKTGYKDTTPSERNWQIRTQVVSLWHEHPQLEEIVGGVASSRLRDKLDISVYTKADLIANDREIAHAVWKSQQVGASRQAGTWCEYCPAKAYCAEASVYVATVSFGFRDVVPADFAAAVYKMPLPAVVKLFEKEGVVTKIFEAVKDRLKSLPESELHAVGLKLKPGAVNRHVTDPVKALKLLTEPQGDERPLMTYDQAMPLFEPSLTAIEKVVKEHSDLTKEGAKKKVNELLAPVIEKKQNAPSISKL